LFTTKLKIFSQIVPWGLGKTVNWIRKTYNNPEIFITENGYPDVGGLQDDKRIHFYKVISNVDVIIQIRNITSSRNI
jgi:beta-glucosidase/6-phospho-beta-glucosidase/beta-galactosidase